MAATLGELAAQFGCELQGDPGVVVSRVGTLSGATPDAITFLANSLYRAQLEGTRAAAVIVAPRDRDACPVASLVHAEPYLIYARIAATLHPPAAVAAGRAFERGRRRQRPRVGERADRRARGRR